MIERLEKDPEIVSFPCGNKMVKFSMATDDSYEHKSGAIIECTYWHNVVVRGSLVQILEKYVIKVKEIAIEGKLTNRT